MNEQALKERLKNIAKSQKKSFQEVWKLLLLERFLVRLSCSEHQDKFIFKGGLLLSYYLIIARETIDIDLLARRLQAEMPQIESMIMKICDTKIDDGFIMSPKSIEELDHSHMNYPGYRVKLDVQFGKMKDRIQVDIGIGDTVEPTTILWPLYQYKEKPIFENLISLQVYPVETIFSEKLETIVSRGAANSRMKDFHDVLLLCRKNNILNLERIKKNISNTFRNRNTKIKIPIKFTEDDYSRLQSLWTSHLRTLGNTTKKTLNFPDNISELVKEVNVWLERINVVDS